MKLVGPPITWGQSTLPGMIIEGWVSEENCSGFRVRSTAVTDTQQTEDPVLLTQYTKDIPPLCVRLCVCVCLRDCVSVWGYQVAINGLVNGGHCLKVSLFSCYPVTALQVHFHKMSLLLNEGRFYFHHNRAELSTACKPKKKEAPPVLLISIATHLPGQQATVVVVSIYVMDNFFSLLCNLRAAVAFFFDRIMKILPGEDRSINLYLYKAKAKLRPKEICTIKEKTS